MIPYMAKIAADYLREHPDLDVRVVANPPSKTSTPWIQVRRIDAPQDARSPVDHLVAYLMQFDCYAGAEGGAPEAERLGLAVRAALGDMPGGVSECVVTSARIVGDSNIPDPDFEPSRDRVILTARIHAHG